MISTCRGALRETSLRGQPAAVTASVTCSRHGLNITRTDASPCCCRACGLGEFVEARPRLVSAEATTVPTFKPSRIRGKLVGVGLSGHAVGSATLVKRNFTSGDGIPELVWKIKLWNKP